MSLLPPTSTFAERVEALFAGVRGRGLALGPLDVALLAEWVEAGAPVNVIARGLTRAAERVRWNGAPGATPRSLRACRPEVDAEIAAWRRLRVGGRGSQLGAETSGTSQDLELHERSEPSEDFVRRRSGRPAASESAGADEDSARNVARAVRALAFPERLSILRAARAAVVHDRAPCSAWRRALHAIWSRRP